MAENKDKRELENIDLPQTGKRCRSDDKDSE